MMATSSTVSADTLRIIIVTLFFTATVLAIACAILAHITFRPFAHSLAGRAKALGYTLLALGLVVFSTAILSALFEKFDIETRLKITLAAAFLFSLGLGGLFTGMFDLYDNPKFRILRK